MPCEVREFDGHTMIVCSRPPKVKPKCYICGKSAPWLCDYVVNWTEFNPTNNHTCDRPICEEHRIIQCQGIDYCPEHAQLVNNNEVITK